MLLIIFVDWRDESHCTLEKRGMIVGKRRQTHPSVQCMNHRRRRIDIRLATEKESFAKDTCPLCTCQFEDIEGGLSFF